MSCVFLGFYCSILLYNKLNLYLNKQEQASNNLYYRAVCTVYYIKAHFTQNYDHRIKIITATESINGSGN